MLILTKKFKNISLEDIYLSKDFEDMKRSKPMKMGVPSLNPQNPQNTFLDLAKPYS